MKTLADLETDFLFNHPQFCEVLAEWHHSEWGRSSGALLCDSIGLLDRSKSASHLPLVIVAFRKVPVGMAMLVEHDMPSRKDLTPWLSALYVPTSERNNGVGSCLVARVVAEAWRLAYKQIYLFTSDRVGFYNNLDWQVLEKMHYRNSSVAIMIKSSINLGKLAETDRQDDPSGNNQQR
jgi:GNAT superfamily N-acetyltransferase